MHMDKTSRYRYKDISFLNNIWTERSNLLFELGDDYLNTLTLIDT